MVFWKGERLESRAINRAFVLMSRILRIATTISLFHFHSLELEFGCERGRSKLLHFLLVNSVPTLAFSLRHESLRVLHHVRFNG